MPRMIVRLVVIAAFLALTSCQSALPTSTTAKDSPVENAVTGGEIEVTSLDDRAEATNRDPSSGNAPVAEPAPAPEDVPTPTATAISGEAPAAKPEVVKTDAQIGCEKKGGRWTKLGRSIARTCVKVTKDAGKSCSRESQCESQCLARSGTCAPFAPLLGCNEVLQDNGARVTLCIE